MQVIKYLTSSFDIINSTDHQGNTALHVAAYRGQLAAVEALVSAHPSLISQTNNVGETFLHKAVSGFQTPAFRRLDRQVALLKQLLSGKNFHTEEIINVKNQDGRTALHMAIIGNIHTDLVQLLMTAPLINVNACDVDGMTPLDYLRQCPISASSDILIRKLISAGGMFGCKDYDSRKAIASHLKMQGGSSPGTSFRISDTEIFLYTGIENNVLEAFAGHENPGLNLMNSSSSPEHNTYDDNQRNSTATISSSKRPSSVNYAAARLKRVLQWPRVKEKKSEGFSDETPTPLRERFSNRPSSMSSTSLPNNKRTLSVRSNQSSPNAKKKFASGVVHGVIQAVPQKVKVSGRSRSSSFSKSSISSPRSWDNKQKGIYIENDIIAGPSCSSSQAAPNNNVVAVNGDDDESPNVMKRVSVSQRLRGHYFCFGASGLSVKHTGSSSRQHHESQDFKNHAISVA